MHSVPNLGQGKRGNCPGPRCSEGHRALTIFFFSHTNLMSHRRGPAHLEGRYPIPRGRHPRRATGPHQLEPKSQILPRAPHFLGSALRTFETYSLIGPILGLWLRLECSLDSLSIDSAHVIYVSEGYDVAYNRRTASQPSYVVLRVTWYVKTFRNVNYVC